MNDDELGRFLRDEVPPPAADYWDRIDARLAAAARPDDGSDGMQTDEVVVRLTDMHIAETPRRLPWTRLLAVAAAVLLLAGLVVVLLPDDAPDADLDVADETPRDTSAVDSTPTDAGPVSLGPVEPGVHITLEEVGLYLEPRLASGPFATVAAGETFAISGERWLADGIEWFFLPSAQEGEADSWIPAAALTFTDEGGDDMLTPDTDGVEEIASITPGSFVVIGDIAPLRPVAGTDVEIVDSRPGGTRFALSGERALADGLVWLRIGDADDLAGLWVAQIDVQREGTIDLDEGSETLVALPPGTYRVTGDGPINVRDDPGLESDVIGSVAVGEEVAATGVRSVGSGREWYEVTLDAATAWVAAGYLVPS